MNRTGCHYLPEKFKGACVYDTNKFIAEPIDPNTNVHYGLTVEKKPLSLFAEENECDKIDHNYHLEDFFKSLLREHENEEGKHTLESFMELIGETESKIKKIFEILKYIGEKTLYELFANKKQINHISGKEWRNFGETLLNEPAHFFSDDAPNPVGYLLYEDGHYYYTEGKDQNKKHRIHLIFPKNFYSPVTLEHLTAIVQLAKEKGHKIKVKTFFLLVNFFY